MECVPEEKLDRLIDEALSEDAGTGDVTSRCMVPAGVRALARLEAKAVGVLAGLGAAERVFLRVDASVSFRALARDGEEVRPGQRLAEARGPARSLLLAERTALNFLCRLSGVATLTRRYVSASRGPSVYDTRKTTPGWRELEKYAVRAGGGCNHRMGLYDQVLVKENHLRVSGLSSLAEAVKACEPARARGCRVEVEVESLEECRSALGAGADIIMLDDMSDADVARAVAMRGDAPAILEVSGGLSPERLASLPAGVDRVSVGALTHSAPALDLALYLEPEAGGSSVEAPGS